LELAEKLGKAIASDGRYTAMRKAEEAVANDAETQDLLNEYEAQEMKIARLEAEFKPIEADDKQKLAVIRDRAAANELLKALLSSKMEYAVLMQQVTQAIERQLRPAVQE